MWKRSGALQQWISTTICKILWRLFHVLEWHFSQRCWRAHQNLQNCEQNFVPTDFDPPCSVIWKASTITYWSNMGSSIHPFSSSYPVQGQGGGGFSQLPKGKRRGTPWTCHQFVSGLVCDHLDWKCNKRHLTSKEELWMYFMKPENYYWRLFKEITRKLAIVQTVSMSKGDHN